MIFGICTPSFCIGHMIYLFSFVMTIIWYIQCNWICRFSYDTFHVIDNPKKSRYLSNKGERWLSPGGSNSNINLASKLEKDLFVKFSKPRGIWNEIRHLSHFLSNPDRRTILGCQNFLSFMVQFKYATVSWYCRLKTYIYWKHGGLVCI